jgi:hypothetical protein
LRGRRHDGGDGWQEIPRCFEQLPAGDGVAGGRKTCKEQPDSIEFGQGQAREVLVVRCAERSMQGRREIGQRTTSIREPPDHRSGRIEAMRFVRPLVVDHEFVSDFLREQLIQPRPWFLHMWSAILFKRLRAGNEIFIRTVDRDTPAARGERS